MRKLGVLVFVLSLVIFILAINVAISNTLSRSVGSIQSTASFDTVRDRGDNRTINVKEDTKLKFKISTYVEKGSLTFTIKSPDNKVVYKEEGKSFSDIMTIPVTKGVWSFNVETDYAEKGNYLLRAEVDYGN